MPQKKVAKAPKTKICCKSAKSINVKKVAKARKTQRGVNRQKKMSVFISGAEVVGIIHLITK